MDIRGWLLQIDQNSRDHILTHAGASRALVDPGQRPGRTLLEHSLELEKHATPTSNQEMRPLMNASVEAQMLDDRLSYEHAASDHSTDVLEPYQRRKRRKTRHDKYELKPVRPQMPAAMNSRQHHRASQKRRRKQNTTACPSGDASTEDSKPTRLTLAASSKPKLGLFNRGFVSRAAQKHTVVDQSFSESQFMDMQNAGKRHDEQRTESVPHNPKHLSARERMIAQEEHLASYFDGKRVDRTAQSDGQHISNHDAAGVGRPQAARQQYVTSQPTKSNRTSGTDEPGQSHEPTDHRDVPIASVEVGAGTGTHVLRKVPQVAMSTRGGKHDKRPTHLDVQAAKEYMHSRGNATDRSRPSESNVSPAASKLSFRRQQPDPRSCLHLHEQGTAIVSEQPLSNELPRHSTHMAPQNEPEKQCHTTPSPLRYILNECASTLQKMDRMMAVPQLHGDITSDFVAATSSAIGPSLDLVPQQVRTASILPVYQDCHPLLQPQRLYTPHQPFVPPAIEHMASVRDEWADSYSAAEQGASCQTGYDDISEGGSGEGLSDYDESTYYGYSIPEQDDHGLAGFWRPNRLY